MKKLLALLLAVLMVGMLMMPVAAATVSSNKKSVYNIEDNQTFYVTTKWNFFAPKILVTTDNTSGGVRVKATVYVTDTKTNKTKTYSYDSYNSDKKNTFPLSNKKAKYKITVKTTYVADQAFKNHAVYTMKRSKGTLTFSK